MRLATIAVYVAALCCSHVQTLSASSTVGLGGNDHGSATDRLIRAVRLGDEEAAYYALNDGADVDALFRIDTRKVIPGKLEELPIGSAELPEESGLSSHHGDSRVTQ